MLWIFDWRKVLVYTHRWLGIAGCVLFIAWFMSGIVMMYARMPGLAKEERLARAQPLDLAPRRSPNPAKPRKRSGCRGDRMQVGMLKGRPVYRFGGGRSLTIVFADTGDFFDGMDKEKPSIWRVRMLPDTPARPLRGLPHRARSVDAPGWNGAAAPPFRPRG